MKTAALFLASFLGAANAAALVQPEPFEPVGFNVTEQLEHLGIHVEDLPVAALATRSPGSYACSAAVS
jgi:hypothetical protein